MGDDRTWMTIEVNQVVIRRRQGQLVAAHPEGIIFDIYSRQGEGLAINTCEVLVLRCTEEVSDSISREGKHGAYIATWHGLWHFRCPLKYDREVEVFEHASLVER